MRLKEDSLRRQRLRERLPLVDVTLRAVDDAYEAALERDYSTLEDLEGICALIHEV